MQERGTGPLVRRGRQVSGRDPPGQPAMGRPFLVRDTLSPKLEAQAVAPYSRLASIYDCVMQHVDYVHWVDYLERVFVRHDLAPHLVLDLACGTGSLALELRKRDYRVTGADGCPDMLGVAREKARKAGYDIPFFQKDLLDLGGLARFEGVFCLYDSMNYLMTLDDMSNALEAVRGVVVQGGLFIFDICTETNSLRHFRDMKEKGRGNGFTYVRHSFYDDGVQYNRFEIRFEATKEEVCETHRQRIYPISDIERVIAGSPFEIEGAYDGFGLDSPTDESDRVHFVLRA